MRPSFHCLVCGRRCVIRVSDQCFATVDNAYHGQAVRGLCVPAQPTHCTEFVVETLIAEYKKTAKPEKGSALRIFHVTAVDAAAALASVSASRHSSGRSAQGRLRGGTRRGRGRGAGADPGSPCPRQVGGAVCPQVSSMQDRRRPRRRVRCHDLPAVWMRLLCVLPRGLREGRAPAHLPAQAQLWGCHDELGLTRRVARRYQTQVQAGRRGEDDQLRGWLENVGVRPDPMPPGVEELKAMGFPVSPLALSLLRDFDGQVTRSWMC